MRQSFILIILLIFYSLYWFSCGDAERSTNIKEKTTERTPPEVTIPNFNADSAYHYVKTQVEFGPRVPSSLAHEQCANYLINKLKTYTSSVKAQKAKLTIYDGRTIEITNIIASFNPENKNRILLCAHWDTRPWADQDTVRREEPIDGANDGASGVGVLLEIARIVSVQQPAIGIDIALFDLEDYGKSRYEDSYALGTQYWAKNPHVTNYSANYGILLDMVGGKNARFLMEGYSMQYAPSIVRKVWDAASKSGYSDYFIYEEGGFIMDDHYYINTLAHIPTIDIIQQDISTPHHFPHYWHTHQDNLKNIDKETLKAVGQTLLRVIYTENDEYIAINTKK